MQTLGNCTQPFSSRSATNFQANDALGNRNGVYTGGRWNPSDYQGLIPNSGLSPDKYELPGQGGYTSGDWNLSNYGGNNFYFPSSNEFALNNYYGGPTMNVGGNTVFENQYVQNLTVEIINGQPVGGGGGGFVLPMPAGPPPAPPEGAGPGEGAGTGGSAPGAGGGAGVGGGGGGWWIPITPPTLDALRDAVRDLTRRVNNIPTGGSVKYKQVTGATLTSDCKIKLSTVDRTAQVQ